MKKREYLRILFLLTITVCMWLGNEKEAKAYTSNLSTTAVSDNQGCNATNVYARCYFYCNAWDSDVTNTMNSFTAELWQGNVRLYDNSVTATNYFNYAALPFLVTSPGTYTLNGNYTLYAVWKKYETPTNGGGTEGNTEKVKSY